MDNNLVILQNKLRIAENRFRNARCNGCANKYLKQAIKIREQIHKLKKQLV